MDEEIVPLLNTICEKTDCRIVISSSWRIQAKIDELAGWLKQKGFLFPERIIDKTPQNSVLGRGGEIQEWIDSNKSIVDKYAIVDDDVFDIINLHPHNTIATNFVEGLTLDSMDKIIKLLNS